MQSTNEFVLPQLKKRKFLLDLEAGAVMVQAAGSSQSVTATQDTSTPFSLPSSTPTRQLLAQGTDNVSSTQVSTQVPTLSPIPSPIPTPSSTPLKPNLKKVAAVAEKAAAPMATPGSFAGIIMYYNQSLFMVQPTGMAGYGIPKGAVEEGESLEQAARREFNEETGIVIDSTASLLYLEGSGAVKGAGAKKVHAFIYRGTGAEKYISSNLITTAFRKGQPENSGGKYVPISEALDKCHKNQKQLIELFQKWLK